MIIRNDSNDEDHASLYSPFWSGILVGADGYPTKDYLGYYHIAGGDKN